jgi:hypothetical protein
MKRTQGPEARPRRSEAPASERFPDIFLPRYSSPIRYRNKIRA